MARLRRSSQREHHKIQNVSAAHVRRGYPGVAIAILIFVGIFAGYIYIVLYILYVGNMLAMILVGIWVGILMEIC